jgi:cytidine deaminase
MPDPEPRSEHQPQHDPRHGWDELIAAARRAREQAYAPWSGYRVGAALRAADGSLWAAGNVELWIPALGTCAERNALTSALAAGHRCFTALAVVTSSSPPACPCGVCRQALLEFVPAGAELPILCVNEEGERVETRLSELLPRAFRLPEALGSGDG